PMYSMYKHSFPTRRSSDLVKNILIHFGANLPKHVNSGKVTRERSSARYRFQAARASRHTESRSVLVGIVQTIEGQMSFTQPDQRDRKSTRLNSSHVSISYA